LAIGLKVLPTQLRPLFVRLNRVRNKLAHNFFFARLNKTDSNGLGSMVHRDWWKKYKTLFSATPGGEVKTAYFFAWCVLSNCITNHRDNLVRKKAAEPIIAKAMAIVEDRKAKGIKLAEDVPDVEAIVAAERDARKRAGDY
jgi:hypothetical protein